MAFAFTKVGLTQSIGSLRCEIYTFTCLATDTSGVLTTGLSRVLFPDYSVSAGTASTVVAAVSGSQVTFTITAGATAGTVMIVGFP